MKRLDIIIICAASLALLPSCRQIAEIKGEKVKREPVSVHVQEVSFSDNELCASYVGTVEPSKSAIVSSRHSGTLTSLKVRKGERVSKGQVIAEVESQNVRSAYDMAQASLAQAEDGYRRAQQVHDSGSIADVKMVEVEAKLKQARAAAESASKAVEECTIKAPFAGVIDEVIAEEGVSVDVLGPVVRLVDVSRPEIHFSVPENEIGGAAEGKRISVEISALGLSDIAGRIESRGVIASPLSHCYECTAALYDIPQGLMPGMVCKVSLSGSGEMGATVPASVIQTGSDGRYLWLIRDGKVCRQTVTVGGFSGKGVLITGGLNDGDQVIVRGYQKVSSGMEVKIEQ